MATVRLTHISGSHASAALHLRTALSPHHRSRLSVGNGRGSDSLSSGRDSSHVGWHSSHARRDLLSSSRDSSHPGWHSSHARWNSLSSNRDSSHPVWHSSQARWDESDPRWDECVDLAFDRQQRWLVSRIAGLTSAAARHGRDWNAHPRVRRTKTSPCAIAVLQTPRIRP